MTYSRLSLIVAGVGLAGYGLPYVIGIRVPFLYISLIVGLIGLLFALYFERRIIGEFLTTKTTQNGMSTGTMILVVLLSLIAVNFLGVRYNKSVDITSEGINSLSEESLQILKKMDGDLSFKTFYNGDKDAAQVAGLKMSFDKYRRAYKSFKSSFVDAYSDPEAVKYLDAEDANQLVVVIEKEDRFEKIKAPFSEENITSALVRLTQKETKKIYFLTGHGEKSISNDQQGGVAEFVGALKNRGTTIEELNLFTEEGGIPKDASLLVIMAPTKSLVENEIQQIKQWAEDGGPLLLVSEVSTNSNLSEITKSWGVSFKQGVAMVEQRSQMYSPYQIVTNEFSTTSPITDQFDRKSLALFFQAGAIQAVKTPGFTFDKLVTVTSYVVNSAEELQMVKEGKIKSASETLLLELKSAKAMGHAGHNHGGASPEVNKKNLHVILAADSDFLSNGVIAQVFNRDLAMNAVSALVGMKEALNIRPKTPKATQMMMSSIQSNIAVVLLCLAPFLMFIIALVLWFRKRGA